jgi:hypothetical protein
MGSTATFCAQVQRNSMSGLFGDTPAPPTEDPSIAAERQRQQQTAEQDRVRSIQDNLRAQTELDLSSTFGSRSLLAGLSPRQDALSGFVGRARRSLLGTG